MPNSTWSPPFTLTEWAKYNLLPGRFNKWRIVRKALRKGEAELRMLPDLVPRDRTAIDVGANKGVYTHVLSELCAQVIAFEPNPKVFRMLQHGLRDNVIAHQVALSDQGGEAELFIPGTQGKYSTQLGSLRTRRDGVEGRIVRVPTRTLDSYELRNVGFIKIDVEGFEQAVLRGARETLARNRPVILLEMEERHTGEPIEQSIAAVEAYGYDVFFVRDGVLQPATAMVGDPARPQPLQHINNFIAKPRN